MFWLKLWEFAIDFGYCPDQGKSQYAYLVELLIN